MADSLQTSTLNIQQHNFLIDAEAIAKITEMLKVHQLCGKESSLTAPKLRQIKKAQKAEARTFIITLCVNLMRLT